MSVVVGVISAPVSETVSGENQAGAVLRTRQLAQQSALLPAGDGRGIYLRQRLVAARFEHLAHDALALLPSRHRQPGPGACLAVEHPQPSY